MGFNLPIWQNPSRADFATLALAEFCQQGNLTRMKLRIAYWRGKRGWSQEDLAAETGFHVSQVSRWESGDRYPSLQNAEILADKLGVRLRDLLDDIARVPVVGSVGAGQRVISQNDFPEGEGRRTVPCPENLDPRSTVAVEVVGDSMLPIGEGWFLFYRERGGESDVLGKLCVLELLDDGVQLVKRIRPGYETGKFNLISTNANPIENVSLAWAAPVLDIKPPEWAAIDDHEPNGNGLPIKRRRGRPRKGAGTGRRRIKKPAKAAE